MVNLYRVLHQNRTNQHLRKREALMRELAGKESFTNEEIKKILEYRGVPGKYSNNFSEKYTREAFNEQTLDGKLRLLKRLNGVGTLVASTILSFQNPYKFAEIDPLVWTHLRKKYKMSGTDKDHRSDYGAVEYLKYLQTLSQIAEEHGMKLSDVEFTLRLISEEKSGSIKK